MPPVRKLKVIIAGGRSIAADEVSVALVVKSAGFNIGEVVSGACPTGADALGEEWAAKNGIKVRRFPADWDLHGKRAGPVRNAQMAAYADALILIWDGVSRGSRSMLEEARAVHLPLYQFMVALCPQR